MSLRSKARCTGPEGLDDTRTSAHALNLDKYVPAYLTFLAGKISRVKTHKAANSLKSSRFHIPTLTEENEKHESYQ